MSHIFSLQGLETCFKTRGGIVHAVNGVSFDVHKGETIGIVGESGCGKSVTMLSVLGLIPKTTGKILSGKAVFDGQDLLKYNKKQLLAVRGSKISMIFQDPMTSFNPVLPIGRQIAEPLRIHTNISKIKAYEKAIEMLEIVGIPNAEERLDNYPHQFSGGMRQRAMIAMSLICNPEMLIADEPTTALDVTVQAQIVELVKGMKRRYDMAVIWITHDLGVIAGMADRIVVMYGGSIIEEAEVDDLYENPLHPYTRGLLASLPRMDEDKKERLEPIGGLPPTLMQKPEYCSFVNRCSERKAICREKVPDLETVTDTHRVACFITR